MEINAMTSHTKKIALLGVLTALSMVLSYVEMLFPPVWSAVPGIKLGFGNIITLVLLYSFSIRSAAAVSLIRIFLMSLLFGNGMVFLYSLSGATLSIFVMLLLKKTNLFSMVGVSIAGAVAHNLGQIILAIIIMQTKEIGYYMIVLALTGVIAGIFIGIISAIVLKYFKKLRL